MEALRETESAVSRWRVERLTQMQADVEPYGGLEAAVQALFPQLSWDGVSLPALVLDSSCKLIELWGAWRKANMRLSEQCPYCGGMVGWHRDGFPLTSECDKPALLEDGTIAESPCEKRLRAYRRARWEFFVDESHIPRRFLRARLDGFDASKHSSLAVALDTAQAFATGFKSDDAPAYGDDDGIGKPGLLLMGPAGTGKTHLATAVLIALAERGVRSRYATVPDLLAELRTAIGENKVEEVMANWRDMPLVCLDDLGKEHLATKTAAGSGGYETAAWAQEELFRLLDGRYAAERPCIITTNLNEEALTTRYGPALVSRFREMCISLVLDVPDYRGRVLHEA